MELPVVAVHDPPPGLSSGGGAGLTGDDIVAMRGVLAGAITLSADRPLVFKSVGMSWQDLVIAEAVARD